MTKEQIELIRSALDRSLRYYIEADIAVRKQHDLEPDPINDESKYMVETALNILKVIDHE